jgi:hypothetical protein
MSWFSTNHIIFLVLAVAGLLMFFFYFRALARVRASEGWPAVQGTIIESWVDESTTTEEDGTISRRYKPKVLYKYAIMGQEFQGERITFGPTMSGNRSSAEKVLARYPKGSSTQVYYNQENPEDAVLERSISKSMLISGIVLLAIAIFLYIRWG